MRLPCPDLPEADATMSYRCLREHADHSSAFYLNALKYGQYLWLRGHAGRAILASTRALYAPLAETDPVFTDWPLPYTALAWIVTQHHSDDFPGNPRISFQHQATRLRGKREALLRARAWAVWAIICKARPSLTGDLNDPVQEPSLETIEAGLSKYGHANETRVWLSALNR